ncbi:MAG: formyltransferase family protein [Bacteroidota bacterium]
MNICFYTTDQPSVANMLNIGYLVHSRPGHNYSFLNVASSRQPLSLKDQLRAKYAELKHNDGRFDYQRDLAQLSKQLQQHVQPLAREKFVNGFADVVNDEKSELFLKEVKPDLIIQAGAGILKPNTFNLAKSTINVHHGISPEIRGIDSTFWCLFYGIKDKVGVTCHFIDETIDTGAVIVQEHAATTATSFIDIQAANYLLGRDVLVKSVDILDKGDYRIEDAGEVASYYFGGVNPFLYYALKKRNFQPLMKPSDKMFKMKGKRMVV